MYSAYGSNILKKYQVNMGVPYPVKQKQVSPVVNDEEKIAADEKQKKEDTIKNAKIEAERIINAARQQADSTLSSAEEKIAAKMREASQKAQEEGYKHGESLAKKDYQDLISEAEELKQKAKEIYSNTVASLENDMVEIILQVARKVIGTELTQNKDVILGLVRNAVSGTSPTDKISIRVCAENYDYVIENKERILEGFKWVRDFEIIKDSALTKGECLLDTGFGTIDSSIETQLQAVERTLRELLGQSYEEKTAVGEAAFTNE